MSRTDVLQDVVALARAHLRRQARCVVAVDGADGSGKSWFARDLVDLLEEQGREPAQLSYYLNDADAVLALVSGRIDLYLGPYPSGSFREDSGSDTRIVGRISAGWPHSTLVAAPTDKGSGLAPALEAALDSAMRDGTYDEALRRWGLEDEELEDSRTVTDAAQMQQALAES